VEDKKKINGLKPTFLIGKSGLTEIYVKEIEKYLQKHKVVKIKSLTSVNKLEVKKLAEEISKKINCEVLETKGFTFVLSL
jgi:RNA-binding protein YhbY